jgi:hypothetical protein
MELLGEGFEIFGESRGFRVETVDSFIWSTELVM